MSYNKSNGLDFFALLPFFVIGIMIGVTIPHLLLNPETFLLGILTMILVIFFVVLCPIIVIITTIISSKVF